MYNHTKMCTLQLAWELAKANFFIVPLAFPATKKSHVMKRQPVAMVHSTVLLLPIVDAVSLNTRSAVRAAIIAGPIYIHIQTSILGTHLASIPACAATRLHQGA